MGITLHNTKMEAEAASDGAATCGTEHMAVTGAFSLSWETLLSLMTLGA